MSFNKVSKEEFESFVKSFPSRLKYDVNSVCEPPLGSYNDFSNGKVWPESMVARVTLNEMVDGEANTYYIKELIK